MRHLLSTNQTVAHLHLKTTGRPAVKVAQPVLHMFFRLLVQDCKDLALSVVLALIRALQFPQLKFGLVALT